MELAGNNAKEKTQLSLVGFLAGPAQMLRHVGTKKSLNLTWWCRAPNSSTNRALEIMCAHTASRAFRSMAQLKKVLYNYNQRRIRCRRRRRRRRGELADWRETRRNAGCDVPVKIRNSSLSLSLSGALSGVPRPDRLSWRVSKKPTGAIVFVIRGGKEEEEEEEGEEGENSTRVRWLEGFADASSHVLLLPGSLISIIIALLLSQEMRWGRARVGRKKQREPLSQVVINEWRNNTSNPEVSDSFPATVITRNCHFCRTRTWWINDFPSSSPTVSSPTLFSFSLRVIFFSADSRPWHESYFSPVPSLLLGPRSFFFLEIRIGYVYGNMRFPSFSSFLFGTRNQTRKKYKTGSQYGYMRTR